MTARTPSWSFACWLMLGCSSVQTSEEPGPSTLPSGNDDDPLPASSGNEDGDPIAGGETSDFGDGDLRACRRLNETEIGVEQARALGFPVDAHLAWFERTWQTSLHWGPFSCSEQELPSADTELSLSVKRVQLYHATNAATVTPPDGLTCPDSLIYRAIVVVETADGRLAGRFYARFVGPDDLALRPAGDPPPAASELCADALPDLRNFTGSFALPVDLERPHWSRMDSSLCLNESESRGRFVASVTYTDSSDGALHERFGGFWPALALDGAQCGLSQPLAAGPGVVALSDYPGSVVPPTVKVTVRADAVDPERDVSLAIRVDGVPLQETVVASASYVELGAFAEGTSVEASVTNLNGAGSVSAEILANHCFRDAQSCTGPGCVANVAYIAQFEVCED